MKKLLAFLLVILMIITVTGCKKNDEPVADPGNTNQNENQQPDGNEQIDGDPVEYGRDYWEAKYPGSNICPFYIEENGKEYSYYWVSSFEGYDGTLASWIAQPFNWNGWHMMDDGCIVNKDETLKVTDNWVSGDGLSSFCTVTTEPYEKGNHGTGNENNEVSSESVAVDSQNEVYVFTISRELKIEVDGWLGIVPTGTLFVKETDADEVDIFYTYCENYEEENATAYRFFVEKSAIENIEDGTYDLVLCSSDNGGDVLLQIGIEISGGNIVLDYINEK